MEERFPVLRGRVVAMKVPLDRATFRSPVTGGEIRKLVEFQLKGIAALRLPAIVGFSLRLHMCRPWN